MTELKYDSEEDRQKALQVIEDLIQRTETPTNRALYEKQRERILQATVGSLDRKPIPPFQPGPYPH